MSARGGPEHFFRLLDVLLPRGGYVMAFWECYFDESGCDDYSRVLAVGGYLIRSDNARLMETEWRAALDKAGVDFLHMVDCAPGNDIYKNVPKETRIELVKDAIALIKKYTSLGICTIINPQRLGQQDAYAQAANTSVGAIHQWLSRNDKEPELAVFFESGHSSRSIAEGYLRDNLERAGLLANGSVSLTFANRCTVKLLQAADLFAWQVTKNVKDKLSQARPPRKDFLSLCEVPESHVLLYIMYEGGPGEGGTGGVLCVSQDINPARRPPQRLSPGHGRDPCRTLK